MQPPPDLRSIVLQAVMTMLVNGVLSLPAIADGPQGAYFAKKAYTPKPLPKFAEAKGQLPSPIFDENPLYVSMYWKAWELGFRNFYEPRPGSGFVSQFIDAAFNQNIFLWDTCFLTMFCNPATFGRKHRVPTTPADQPGYDPAGGYWCGAVWSPTNTMVVRGLERCGKHALAQQIAREHLATVGEVFRTTGTVWENYAPDAPQPGKPAKGDFVGWTGIVPILYFIEYGLGLRPDAPNNRLTWKMKAKKRCGCERFRFNGHTATLIAEPRSEASGSVDVTVESDGPFKLRIDRGGKEREFDVRKGKIRLAVD